MKKQFAVIGLGRFGVSVARTLTKLGQDVLAIDTSESAVQSIMNDVTHAVQADARDEATLKALGIRNIEVVIVAIGNDLESSVLITLMLKEMGVKKVVAKAINNLHGKVLEKIGVDKVVYPEKDMGMRVANSLMTSNFLDSIEITPDYNLLEMVVPGPFVGKSLGELDVRARYGLNIMLIKREESIIVSPGADTVFQEKDTLVLLGRNEDIVKLPE